MGVALGFQMIATILSFVLFIGGIYVWRAAKHKYHEHCANNASSK